MEQINIYEAKTQLSKLVDRAAAGEPIVISRHGKPMAVLQPYNGELTTTAKRVGGQWHGQVWMADDFDAPDPELEALFYNSDIFPKDNKE